MTEDSTAYRPLTSDERSAMEQALQLAARMAQRSLPLELDDVQRLYDALVQRDEQNDEEVIALGIAFGAAMNARAAFDWVRISDEWGDETCVGPPKKAIHCAPISMVQKRLNRHEPVDLQQLAESLISYINTKVAEGGVGDW